MVKESTGATAAPVKGFVRFRKVSGKHHMFCYVREQKVVLGKGCEDGDVAYFYPNYTPPGSNESWKRIDAEPVTTEEQVYEDAGKPEGTLEVRERSPGWYDVVNTATGNPVNTSAMRKDDAEAMAAGSVQEGQGTIEVKEKLDAPEVVVECPSGYTFGQDHDDNDSCDDCGQAADCQAVKEAASK